MKIDRQKIKGLCIEEYAKRVFKSPSKLYCDMAKLWVLKTSIRRHTLAVERFHYFSISDSPKSDGFLRHYEKYSECFGRWAFAQRGKIEELDKSRTEALTVLALTGVYPFNKCESLDEREILNLLNECKILDNVKFAEYYYNTTLSYYIDRQSKLSEFDNNATNNELERLESKDIIIADYLVSDTPCFDLLCKDTTTTIKVADELAELAYYKTLVSDNEYVEEQKSNNKRTISQRLDLLESLGVFTLPAFQIDIRKTDNSIRNICRLLSNILNEPIESIRAATKRKNMNFNKNS